MTDMTEADKIRNRMVTEKFLDRLNGALDVDTVPQNAPKVDITESEEDLAYARKKLKQLGVVAEDAIEALKDIAVSGNSIEAFGHLNDLIKTAGDLASSVVMNKKIKEQADFIKSRTVQGEKDSPDAPRTITQNNTVFIGSMKDALKSATTILEQEPTNDKSDPNV